MNKISLQLIAVVFVAFAFFAIGVASLIGFQSYQDMKDIAYERVQGAASLFSSEYESQVLIISHALRSMESNHSVNKSLQKLNTLGPSYKAQDTHSETLSHEQKLSYLKNQLQLAQHLLHTLPIYNLNSLAVYHNATYDQYALKQPLMTIVVDHHFIWLFSYPKKGSDQYLVYKLPIQKLNIDKKNLNLNKFKSMEAVYKEIGATLSQQAPHDYLNNLKHTKAPQTGVALNLQKEKFNAAIWTSIAFNVKNPNSHQHQLQYGATILAIQQPDEEQLNEIAFRIGTELAIVDEEHVWVASITEDQARTEGINVDVGERPYIFSEVDIPIASDDNRVFKVMALSNIEGLHNRVQNLIMRLSIITLLAIAITGLVLYLIIRRILSLPLGQLMLGVMEIQQGNLEHEVNVNTHNELHSLASSFNDMTLTIKRQSEDLIKANDHLEEKVRERTEQLANAQNQLILSEKMASLGQLVAGVAHEINTPLGNSLTALSFNQDGLKSIRQKFDNKELTISDFGQYINESAESMNLMDNNLRKASQLVSTFKNVAVNQSVEELVEFSLREEVDEVLLTLRPKLKQSAVNIELDIDAAIRLTSFPGAYYHIISNMIMNCLKHAFPDNEGNIVISASPQDQFVKLIFSDNGVGMDEITASKIFDPFYTTKRGQGGTGLGMYMTYNIVTQRLLGKISVSSTLGEGTRFELLLPLVNEENQKVDKSNLSL